MRVTAQFLLVAAGIILNGIAVAMAMAGRRINAAALRCLDAAEARR